MVGRSRAPRGWSLVVALVALALFVAYVFMANTRWFQPSQVFLIGFFVTFAAITAGYLASGLVWRSFTHLPVAQGSVLAVVPVYEEDNQRVHAVIWSLINQTRPPERIIVVDDGSAEPVVGFKHPLVTWIRQANAGKREAQATALAAAGAVDGSVAWDYIFTVDSDSVIDDDALEHLLRSMSWVGKDGKQVQAATGMIYTRNWRDNLLLRLTDLNIGISCMMLASLRSWLGIQTPTSGAIALYRAPVVLDNLEDYLTSGTMGDDRRLSFYALLRGQVVRVNEAVVETHLPERARGIFKQRSRWAKSAFLGAPFVATNFNPLIVFFYFYPLLFSVMWPLTVFVLSAVWVQTGVPALLYGVIFWWVTAMAMVTIYLAYRPGLTFGQKVAQWFAGLLYPIFGLLLLRSSAYYALATLKDQSWATRGEGSAVVVESNVVALQARAEPAPVHEDDVVAAKSG